MIMKKDNIKLNIVLQILYHILVIIIPLITTPYITRIFSPELVGENSFAINIANYFMLFSALGIETYASRKIPNAEDKNKTICSLLYAHSIFSLIAIVGYYIVILFVNRVSYNLLVIVGLHVIATLFDLNWLFIALEKNKIAVIKNSFIKIISVILIFVLVKTANDLWIYALIISGSTLLCNIIVLPSLFKIIHFVRVDRKTLLNDIKYLFILFLPSLGVGLYNISDKTLVGLLANNSELGLYEQAEKIVQIASTVVLAIGTVSLPTFTRYWKENKDEIETKIKKFSCFSMMIGSSLCFGIFTISTLLVGTYYGEEFIKVPSMIQGLSIVIVFSSIASIFRYTILLPLCKDKEYIISTFVGAITNIILDIILIPFFQANGAVIATIITEFIVLILQIYFCRKYVHIFSILIEAIPFIIFGVVMTLLTHVICDFNIITWKNLCYVIIIGAVIYLSLTFLYLLIFKKLKK